MNYLMEMAQGGYNIDNIDDFHSCMMPWLLKNYNIGKEAVVVDIGAGQGHGLIPLHSNGWHNLIAVDIDSFNFEIFNNKYAIQTYRCNVAIEPLPLLDNSVDAILCFHLIEHLADPSLFVSESYRVLKPGGFLFLVTPDWRKQIKSFWRDHTHVRPFDKISISRLLKMCKFSPVIHSWGSRFGLGRVKAYRFIPWLGLIGLDILAVGEKNREIF